MKNFKKKWLRFAQSPMGDELIRTVIQLMFFLAGIGCGKILADLVKHFLLV